MLHYWGERSFVLGEFYPQEDECKYLLLKVLEQAIRDFVNLSTAETAVEKQYFESACGFLFDEDYAIKFGDEECSLQAILDILGIDIDWFREHVEDLKRRKVEVPELTRRLIGKSNKSESRVNGRSSSLARDKEKPTD